MEQLEIPVKAANKLENENHSSKISFTKEMKRHWQLYTLTIPALSLLLCFAYLPIIGLVIAFKQFNFQQGMFFSDWAHPIYNNFLVMVNNSQAWNAIRNTVLLNLLFIFTGTVFSLALAIMLNEITGKVYKKIVQSITFLPYFISWIVVGMFVSAILNYDNGIADKIVVMLGFKKVNFYLQPNIWPFILMCANIWKSAGYGAVVYLATIAGFSTEFYEAAQIDGATRFQEIKYITLPLLKPTVIILTLLAVGGIMRSDFGLFYFVTSNMPSLYPTTDVIDTFIYRGLTATGSIGISTATGLFQSVLSLIIVLFFNRLANKVDEGGGLF